MKLIVWVLLFFLTTVLIISLNYKTDFSDLPYPATIKKVVYTPCTFTINHSSNIPQSKDYGIYKTESLPLFGMEPLSEKSCMCVEDALQFYPKGIQQFKYDDNPFFTVKVKNNKFDITLEVKDYIGTKRLNFNEIVKNNKNHLCDKWSY